MSSYLLKLVSMSSMTHDDHDYHDDQKWSIIKKNKKNKLSKVSKMSGNGSITSMMFLFDVKYTFNNTGFQLNVWIENCFHYYHYYYKLHLNFWPWVVKSPFKCWDLILCSPFVFSKTIPDVLTPLPATLSTLQQRSNVLVLVLLGQGISYRYFVDGSLLITTN